MNEHKKFYDRLSEDYDSMISFDKLLIIRTAQLKKILPGDINKCADLGSGTGIDSIALNKLGYKVDAFDVSAGMLKKARNNAGKYKSKINFKNISLSDIDTKKYNDYDAVVSLGNTLSNLNRTQLKKTIGNIYKMLNKNGMAVIQVLNYQPVLKKESSIVNITSKDNNIYIRYYEFLKDFLKFNILRINKADASDYSYIKTKIYPHIKNDYDKLLRAKGFKNIKYYGDMNSNKFSSASSKDLVIIAKK